MVEPYPSEKWFFVSESQLGWCSIPNCFWKDMKAMLQTTNQMNGMKFLDGMDFSKTPLSSRPLSLLPWKGFRNLWAFFWRLEDHPTDHRSIILMDIAGLVNVNKKLVVCQNLVPLVNIKIAGKWMFIPLKMVLIGIDPYPTMENYHFCMGKSTINHHVSWVN